MSDIETSCPYCNSLFSVDEAYMGQNLPCPNCGNTFLVERIPPPVQIAQPVQQAAPMYQPAQMMPQMAPQMPVQQPMYQPAQMMPPPGMGQPYGVPQAPYGYKPKERITYIILGLVLGGFGVHNFYAGYTGKAVAQLLITVLSLGWLALVVSIWVIVDVCTIRQDARGIPFV